ncbi:N-acyl homoserine lactonase family protein [Dictyobacter aurantiacus]|uniref:MBL fold metallo-hydrolase n=1 Tax=Dictyobacter aurantiacus TaxID=1936993 RepID=A0A401ZJX3_9CHLR|nr:N-acyl homoserine lactonase family protein [Dictyobacter aurantiacus]GCE07153.1 MBL fold metallo-hydrolase [Dictyobacter aurantiacus]
MNTVSKAPVRLYMLQLALGTEGTPVPGYLIQTGNGKNILIDTGVPLDGSFKPNSGESPQIFSVVEQLATLGLTPADIDILICTHFDPDHAGNHDAFPTAELVVQRAHYEFALASDSPRFNLTRAHWNHPSLRYRIVDGDTQLLPGVELIETSGHVPGHQAVLVRLPETGPVLLAIDAAAMESDLNPETREYENGVDLDPAQALASARKLFQLVQREGVTLTVFGHDEKRWPELKKAPEYYS